MNAFSVSRSALGSVAAGGAIALLMTIGGLIAGPHSAATSSRHPSAASSQAAGSASVTLVPPTSAEPAGPADPNTSLSLYGGPIAATAFVASYPQLKVIADQPQATWLVPEVYPEPAAMISTLLSKAANRTLQLVVAGVPNRDNGGYSRGGVHTASQYYSWVNAIGAAVGNAKAIVILEPNSLALSSRLKDVGVSHQREGMLANAARILKKRPNVRVYIDASMWIPVHKQASLLSQAGIGLVDGFAVNVAGFDRLSTDYAYGDALSALVGGKHYIVDTSRSGQGRVGNHWCNPAGRGLGPLPQGKPAGHPLADALLWVKHPGESDGGCDGAPSVGTFWPKYAMGLVARANFAVN